MSPEPKPGPAPRDPAAFRTTRWSLVAHADRQGSREALTELCVRYWYPVYAYVRRCGHEPTAAYELARGFFARLIERGEGVRSGTRFRTFLIEALHRYLASSAEERRATAAGPGAPVALDELEARSRHELAPGASPDQAFAHGYAVELIASSLRRLRNEADAAGRAPLFERLEPWLAEEPAAGTLEAIAADIGTRPLAVVIALRRLRERFRELVDHELVQTVTDAETLAAEREALARVLAAGGAPT